MGRIAWRKVRRDLWLTRGRTTLMIGTVALSISLLGGILGAYAILAREMPLSYLGSRPASATLLVDGGVDSAVLAAARLQPGIAVAEARGYLRARAEIGPGRWLPLTLFVVDDFDRMQVETLVREGGAWPPPSGTMLVERGALSVLETEPGAALTVQTPNGQPRSVPISGVVRDLGVAPAWQEQSGYAYVTPDTLAWLGEAPVLDQLKIVVADRPLDAASIERMARDASQTLQQQGRTVTEIRIPPPGEHPHQRLMNALAFALLLFSGLALGLAAVLVATLISGLLTRHVRQIGTMKAIGGRPAQIATMYATMVLLIGAATLLLSGPISVAAGLLIASTFADLSNVALSSLAIPWWVFVVEGVAGLLLPLVAAAAPVLRASRVTVREALGEAGVSYRPLGGPLGSIVAQVSRTLGPGLTMAARNAFRRPARLALSLALLTAGGGIFVTGFNLAESSDRVLAAGVAARTYDFDLLLSRRRPIDDLLRLVRGVPGVQYAEPSDFVQVSPAPADGLPLSRTYKDGGHGSLMLRAVPTATRFPPTPPRAGRWLLPGETNALVVTQGAAARMAPIGGTVSLAVDGRATSWQVVGIVDEPMGLTSAYATEAGLAKAIGQAGTTQAVRVVAAAQDAAGREATRQALERALGEAGIGISNDYNAAWVNLVLHAHLAIVQGALQFLGLVMGLVGALTLATSMSTSVVERTREIGVLQALGATPARVIGIVVAEGTFIGGLSWLGAVALSSLLTSLLGSLVGAILFQQPLPFVVSPAALAIWLGVVLIGSAAASAYPARAASRLTIREACAYI